ncbi:DUF4373 domain-containing protein [Paenibacillus rhizophilus]|uniref:DUF4373 domain-containing protein n=1 Tax=Paenibacillus rhizophilus TaxID=1850366 RepID=A0A3N9P3A3_9BACL|nr:DUF4373 domain-containing protein [Paenibacillus rhizophilus]RQW09937.1 DUF4373 domain-containing protein [Paenibacillus rhizophilus]
MKDAYYFSHDSNARHDPKISAMIGVYGAEGYGWYWMLIEMMRESSDYKLDMQAKYAFNAYASQMHSDCTKIAQLVHDCIHEFKLFSSDGECFWSDSLNRRMAKRDEVSRKKSEAAKSRWGKGKSAQHPIPENAEEMHMHSGCNADGMQGKESKEKESKEKENIKPLCDSPAAEPHADPYHPDFERFWKVFPTTRRKDKAKAFATWKKKVKPSEREALISCTILYSKDFKTIGLHSEFAKMPTTYLNAGTYKDYLSGGEDDGPEGFGSSGRGQAAYPEYDELGPPPPEPEDIDATYYGDAPRDGRIRSEGKRPSAPSDDDIFVRR